MLKSGLPLCVILLFLIAVPKLMAEVWNVDSDGSPGVDCDCTTIQACIDSAAAGDTVLVACGSYFEHNISVKSGIALMSESGEPDCATIDAEQLNRVMSCVLADNNTIIKGFTLTGGLRHEPGNLGAGLYCSQSSPQVVSCRFSANSVMGSLGSGGGMFCSQSSPLVSRCDFRENHASMTGGGLCGDANSFLVVDRCIFAKNSAGLDGGGVAVLWSPGPFLEHCVFSHNTAAGAGGGLFCYYYSHPVMNGCTFYDNTASQGSAIFGSNSSPTLENTILAFGNGGSPVACEGYAGAAVSCCDVYGNEGGDWVGCLEGQLGIDGNFSECPLFCDAANDDYSLQECSPCAPGNHPDGYPCGLIGAFGVSCGGSATERTTWGAVKAMYR